MTARSSLTSNSAPDRLRDAAPSAKLVAKTLEYEEQLTQQQLAEETRLSPRTVRYALTRLEEEGLVASRISFQDARQQIYSLDFDNTGSADESAPVRNSDD